MECEIDWKVWAMADDSQVYVVGGIGFLDMESAKVAQNELKRIEVLDQKMDYDNTEAMAAVYEKARQNHIFKTPIGISYMMRLQNYLVQNQYPGISDMPILVATDYTKKAKQAGASDEVWKARLENAKESTKKATGKLRLSIVINIVLAALVVGLFIISQTGNNPTVLNYKSKILNEYSQWQQQLDEREHIIMQREAELGIGAAPALEE